MTSRSLAALAAPLLTLGCAAAPPAAVDYLRDKPRLVVVLVFDQMRADYLTRFASRFLPAEARGFRHLMENGAWYPRASYGLLQAMTGPGHATVLTGSFPYRNNVAINNFCTTTPEGDTVSRYCVEDQAAALVGADPPLAQPGSPASCTTPSNTGVSPRRLSGTTVGDELKIAGHASRVVSIAHKDRAAVLLGGHFADLALWFDTGSFRWISSRYYLPAGALPDWVQALNARNEARRDRPLRWTPQGTPTGLTAGTFDISLRAGQPDAVLRTPFGAELVVDAALESVRALGLGKGKAPDLLAIGFSHHDYLGHEVGPNRIEMEELTVAEDQQVSRLLRGIAAALPGGLDDALVVLTGDHGVQPSPPFVRHLARGDAGAAGYLDGLEIRAQAEEALSRRWGPPPRKSWVAGTVDLNFWLNHRSLQAKGIPAEQAERELREVLQQLIPEAAFVLTRTDVEARRVPGGELARRALRGYLPGQNGDVLVIPKPFFVPAGDVAVHFADTSHELTVPLLIAGRAVKPGVQSGEAQVVDIAPTISFLLGTVAPALSEGRVLSEALRPLR